MGCFRVSQPYKELGLRLSHRHRGTDSCPLRSGEGAGVEPNPQPSPWLAPEATVNTAARGDACLTCDIEVGVAGSFAQLVGDDTFIDTSVLRPHSWKHQAMYIPVCWGEGEVIHG